MKSRLTITLLAALAIAGSAVAQADPPVVVVPTTAPASVSQRDGPFRLLVAARGHANRRRAQGFQTEIIRENAMWWVAYYR